VNPLTITVNGRTVRAAVEPRTHLADFLRETRNLTGTHLGCEHGVCGACTLLIDGAPARSCITYAVACEGATITTIEGLDDDEIVTELRTAFSREHALQCGYCTPGMLVSARDIVLRADVTNERDIRVAMSGNLCRCTGYVGIIRAVASVLHDRRARGVAAVPHAGRTALGPVGSGHADGEAAVTSSTSPLAGREAVPDSATGIGTASAAAEAPADFRPQTTFEQGFVVHHPIADVWAFFGRVSDVAACLPGVALTGTPSERHAEGQLRIKVGPIAAAFAGAADIERDAASRSGTIRGHGRDARGGSATRGVIGYRLSSAGATSTRVDLTIGYTLTGPLAQFGRSDLVRDIAQRLIDAFVQNLEARLTHSGEIAPPQQAELKAGSLMLSVVWRRMTGGFARLLGR
jgi:carbon-monoxide dehydrogenase small subunit